MFAFSQFYSFESVGSSFVSSDAFRKFSLDTTLRPVISSTLRLAMPPAFPPFTAAFLFSSKPCPYQWQRYGSRLRPMLLKPILNLSSRRHSRQVVVTKVLTFQTFDVLMLGGCDAKRTFGDDRG